MPAQHERQTRALGKPPRIQPLPNPGVGGYDYPRGPYGATGFPGSTPAALARTGHTQQRPEGGRGLRQQTITQNQAEWATVPTRRANGTPRQPTARTGMETAPERRSIPDIGGAPGSQNVRNSIAQRYKARPEIVRGYRPSPNPGKTGARLSGPSQYHPGTTVFGAPDGAPVPGMAMNPGSTPPQVFVQSRFVEYEGGSQEGYAMNRPLLFAKGGTPADIPHGAAPHLRGARNDGTRYFGALADQQLAHGAGQGSYGIARARGPRHRPVRFEPPTPWAANYYDAPPEQDQARDLVHQSPAAPPRAASTSRGGSRRTSRG